MSNLRSWTRYLVAGAAAGLALYAFGAPVLAWAPLLLLLACPLMMLMMMRMMMGGGASGRTDAATPPPPAREPSTPAEDW